MKQYYVTFENEAGEEIKDHHCADLAEQQTMINAWNAGKWMTEFPAGSEYAYAWNYEPIAEYTPADTTRRSFVTGQYKPGGIDY